MKTELEEKMNKQKTDWVLKHFQCKGLDPHNESIKWICDTVDKLNATIEIVNLNKYYNKLKYYET